LTVSAVPIEAKTTVPTASQNHLVIPGRAMALEASLRGEGNPGVNFPLGFQ
jgi:hypothetical protein